MRWKLFLSKILQHVHCHTEYPENLSISGNTWPSCSPIMYSSLAPYGGQLLDQQVWLGIVRTRRVAHPWSTTGGTHQTTPGRPTDQGEADRAKRKRKRKKTNRAVGDARQVDHAARQRRTEPRPPRAGIPPSPSPRPLLTPPSHSPPTLPASRLAGSSGAGGAASTSSPRGAAAATRRDHGHRRRHDAADAAAGRCAALHPWPGSPPPAPRRLAYVSTSFGSVILVVRVILSLLAAAWGIS